MTQVKLPAAAAPHDKSECPFCRDPTLLHYNTKHGAIKDEDVLGVNLANDGMVTTDKAVGSVYPIPGAGDKTSHWAVREGVFEDVPTEIAATPHHIIPGDAAMAKVPALEQWTRASPGMIKEDIGYNIDGAPNGIFLPRYPDLFGTKHITFTDAHGAQQKKEMRRYYGKTWSDLSGQEKKDIAYSIMTETFLQIHHTSHGAIYLGTAKSSYDNDAKDACQKVADLVVARRLKCPDNSAKPYDPPYDVVHWINSESYRLRIKITGNPKHWTAWVTRLANEFTVDLRAARAKLKNVLGISLVTRKT